MSQKRDMGHPDCAAISERQQQIPHLASLRAGSSGMTTRKAMVLGFALEEVGEVAVVGF
jgi:hypothetical protein